MSTFLRGAIGLDHALQIYVVNDTRPSGWELVYIGRGYIVEFKGSKDVYYFSMKDARLYVYRGRQNLQGCVAVRNADEYLKVYNMLQGLGVQLPDPIEL